jgi:hypothetical protein
MVAIAGVATVAIADAVAKAGTYPVSDDVAASLFVFAIVGDGVGDGSVWPGASPLLQATSVSTTRDARRA